MDARRASRWLPWAVPGALGLLAGALLGAQFAWLDSGPSGEIPPTLGTAVLAIALVGGTCVLGLILAIPGGTRGVAQVLFLSAAMFVVGWPVGTLLGPRYQFGRTTVGEVTLTMTTPVAGRLHGDAVCTSADNSTRVQVVEAGGLGRIGIDGFALRLRIMESSPVITLYVNDRAPVWSRPVDLAVSGAELRSGRGSFREQAVDPFSIGGAADGGAPGPVSISGIVEWTCQPPVAGSGPVAGGGVVLVGNLSGWFTLEGLVEMPHPCAGSGGCLPYGSAFGSCTAGKAQAMDGIVPWVGSRRARLHLVPSSRTATLTVEVDDGSPPMTAEAPATFQKQPSGDTLAAEFELPDGRLWLQAEWSCADDG